MPFDLIIRDPLILDGTGRKPTRNDVGVLNGRIESIGDLSHAQADRVIEANGKVLCPGFIDVHSHADMTVVRPDHPRLLEPLVRQGITTFVGGNCGVSLGPVYAPGPGRDLQMTFYDLFTGERQDDNIRWTAFGQMLDTMESQGVLLNTAVLAPHGILRMGAMGDSTTRASSGAIRQMKRVLAECLEAGAVGLSTGLMYFPGLSADTWELLELARVVHDYNGVFTSHLRSYNSDTLGDAIDEVVTIGQTAEVPVQISHLFWIPNLPGPLNPLMRKAVRGASYLYNNVHPFPIPIDSAVKPHLDKIARLIAKGVPVGVDAMPTSAGFTHVLAFFPPWSLQGSVEEIVRKLKDPAERLLIRKSIENGKATWPHRAKDTWSMNLFKIMGWECATIMSVVTEKNQPLIGRTFVDIARERNQHPFDVICDLILEENGRVLIFETATFPGDEMVELSLQGTLLDPNVSVVTDTILFGFGRPSHLFYDAYPKFLGEYVRERKLLPLTEAVRKCTSLPARQLGLRNRGQVAKGFWADLVLFDPDTIRSRGSATDPVHFPEGVHTVMVNGKVVVDPEGFHPEPRPGRVLRSGG